METELSHSQLCTLLEWSPAIIAVVDTEGTIHYVTPSVERILGHTQETLVGADIDDYVHQDDREDIVAAYESFDPDEGSEAVELDYRFGDADNRWVWLELERIQPTGSALDGVVLVSKPVGDRKATERKLDRLTVFDHSLRHDLRNDVHIILNWLDGLTVVTDDDSEEAPIERIRNAAMHMVELTEEGREYVHTLHETDENRGEKTKLPSVIERVVDRRREMYPGATFTVEEVPATTIQAPPMLDSVFRNLLNNAVQHNDSDTPEVRIGFDETDEFLEVVVADNGPGMPEKLKDTLATDTDIDPDDAADTGVGLIIVKQLVEDVDGTLSVEDNDPTGTAFTVSLPKANKDYVGQLLGR